jgi:hypothetical protein
MPGPAFSIVIPAQAGIQGRRGLGVAISDKQVRRFRDNLLASLLDPGIRRNDEPVW